MSDDTYSGDDRISRPPEGAVLIQRMGSWDVLFSQEERSIYIVSNDYHPEPFRISLKELKSLQSTLKLKLISDPAPEMTGSLAQSTGSALKQKSEQKKKRRHSKRMKQRR